MKELIERDEVAQHKHSIIKLIRQGAVFIYPTDTIYGIGCDATNAESVKKLREIKERPDSPFSVIAPSRKWIEESCEIKKEALDWMKKLPGPYTLVLSLKKKAVVSKDVNPGLTSLGIRVPDHWITELLQEAQVPIVTTSVNRSGREIMTSLDDLSHKIKSKVDFIIYEGEKKGIPSTIVDLSAKEHKVIKRK